MQVVRQFRKTSRRLTLTEEYTVHPRARSEDRSPPAFRCQRGAEGFGGCRSTFAIRVGIDQQYRTAAASMRSKGEVPAHG